MATEVTVRVFVPVFATVTVWALLTVPTLWLGKANVAGLAVAEVRVDPEDASGICQIPRP
jgi:hypothetical protein